MGDLPRRGARWPLRALLIAALLVGTSARGLTQSLPALTGPVNDFARVIDASSARDLDQRIRSLESATGDAVVVATIDTFAPFGSIEEMAVRWFEQAGIGRKGKDNGVLIVLAVKDRRARIEVGYDLEAFITDGFAGQTIREAMLPAFREGAYGAGLLAGATRVIQRIADKRGVTLSDVPNTASRSDGPEINWVVIAIVVLFIILRLWGGFGGGAGSLRRRGGPWGRSTWTGWHGGVGGFGGGFGGGGGGGFGGFGGGRSGGGGASGGW